MQGLATPRPRKKYAWSYSKLKNFETCPKRHYEIDIAKTFQEDADSPALKWGNEAHKALADACAGKAPLPTEFMAYQHWVDRVRTGPGELLVEQKFAINRNFEKRGYFDSDVWYRGIGDVLRIDRDIALVLDWKTGKILEDSVQLMLMAQCVFSHYPAVTHVRSEFVWLKDDCTSPEVFTRQEVADQWIGLIERVNALEEADRTQNYPPKPGRLCKRWCPVVSCPFHGKGTR